MDLTDPAGTPEPAARPVDWEARWRAPGWRAEIVEWAAARLGELGRRVTGPERQGHVRFWSTVLIVPTDAGTVFVKENNRAQAFEAALAAALAEIVPERVVEVLAVEPGRGWLMTADGGPTLRDRNADDPLAWTRVLREFALLQRAVETHARPLLATGLSAVPEDTLAEQVAARVDELAGLPARDPSRLTMDARHLEAGLARLGEAASALGASGIPASLQHNDLHDANALDGEPLRFFDFGDAVWTHPFPVLTVTMPGLLDALGAAPGDARATHALDTYLGAWSDRAPLPRLRELVPHAVRVGAVHRAISWRRLLDSTVLERVDRRWVAAEAQWLTKALG